MISALSQRRYSLKTLRRLDDDALRQRLEGLGLILSAYTEPCEGKMLRYIEMIGRVTDELRKLGHVFEIRECDQNGCFMLSWDYEKPETEGRLQVQFHLNGEVKAFWSTLNPQPPLFDRRLA